MNVVVDSSAWIEYFIDGPNAGLFEDAIQRADELIVPSVSVLEVYRYVLREEGRAAALRAELWTQDVDFEGLQSVRYHPKQKTP